MSLYNQGDDQDYSSRVPYTPPPPRFRSGSNWGSTLVIFLLVLAVGYLLWDKLAGSPSLPSAAHHPPITDATITTTSTDNVPSPPVSDPVVSADNSSSAAMDEYVELDVEPRNGRVEFYQSREAPVVATVTGNTSYRISWSIDPNLTHLHYREVSANAITVWATGLVYPNYTDSNTEDGHEAIRLEIYSQTSGKLLASMYFEVWVMEPLAVSLPGAVCSDTDPLANRSTPIIPTVKWEGRIVLGPDPLNDPQSPPSGMSFEWVWSDDGSILSTDPICMLPGNYFKSGELDLTVTRLGFSAQASTNINPPRSTADLVRQ